MASLRYLWKHRAKFSVTSIYFYRAWAKRILSFNEFVIRNYRRSTLIRKGALIDDTAEIGVVIIEGPKKFLTIGRFSFIGRVKIDLHEEVNIGNYVCINDGVEILTASHDVMDPNWKSVKAQVIIEDYAWICTGAMILPGVHIGKGAVVGARAVVSKSVLPGSVVVGNPARPISKWRDVAFSYNPCALLVSNLAWLKG